MAKKKQETLVLFPDVFMSTKKMSDEQFGALMRAVFAYRFEGSAYEGEDLVVDMAFRFVKTQLDRYAEVCETNRTNAKKNIHEEAAIEVNEIQPMEAIDSQMQPMEAIDSEMQRNTPHIHTHNHTQIHTHTHTQIHTHTQKQKECKKEGEADKPPHTQLFYPGVDHTKQHCTSTGYRAHAQPQMT